MKEQETKPVSNVEYKLSRGIDIVKVVFWVVLGIAVAWTYFTYN